MERTIQPEVRNELFDQSKALMVGNQTMTEMPAGFKETTRLEVDDVLKDVKQSFGMTEPATLDQVDEEPLFTKRKAKGGSHRRIRYNRHSSVAKWLDDKVERIHKKLHMENIQEEQKQIIKEAGMDALERAGIVQAIVSQRKRRKEINRNNKKLINALQD